MPPRSERASNAARAALAVALTLTAAATRAQPPTCAWGDGVVLRAGANQPVLIADDGAAGVVAVTYFDPGVYGQANDLRFFHVLEQGRLDPSLPAAGVPFISSADLPGHAGVSALRVVSDGVGGAYVLFFMCGQYLGHLECNVAGGEVRLMHVTGQGTTAPGWPALGLALGGEIYAFPLGRVDIVSDGASGVIASWIDPADPNSAAPLIRAQRFAPDGSTLWPGGGSGLVVLGAQTMRVGLRLGSDHAGGCTIVTSEEISGKFEQYQLRAGRVDASGSLPWTTTGKLVITQPTYSTTALNVSVDAQGRSFVTAYLYDVASNVRYCYTQLLTPTGIRLWGQFGTGVGRTTNQVFVPTGLVTPSGFLTVHGDLAGTYRLQLQDEFGGSGWDPANDGLAADWTLPSASQLPVAAPDGHVLTVWNNQGPVPARDVRALELDESGTIVPGWPVDGVHVCGSQPGHDLADAMVSHGQLFVALGAGSGFVEGPKIQRLSRAVLDAPEARSTSALELAPPSPNPSRGVASVRVSVGDPVTATLEVFDVAGRRVLARDLGGLSAGPHVVPVEAGALAPGLYRLRVRAGDHAAERVLIRIR